MDIEKLKILSNHYTHTFDFLQTYLKKRDRLFSVILLILAVLLFQIYTPSEASSLMSKLIEKKVELQTTINLLFIQSIIWFVLLAVVIKYFQSVVFIERQYTYLHSLEKSLSSEYNSQAFTREGKSYLFNYPIILTWVSFLYKTLFPAILVIVTTSKIVSEYRQYGHKEILVWFNLTMHIFILISIGLYVYGFHHKNKGT